MDISLKKRRSLLVLIISLAIAWAVSFLSIDDLPFMALGDIDYRPGTALEQLDTLEVKGRAPKTDYERAQFGSGWGSKDGCTTRNQILYRDLSEVKMGDNCQVESGRLDDPYTAAVIFFVRGSETSNLVQIDHVVALSNAWQTGAQKLTYEERVKFANDPINLLAVDGSANQQKGDSDAATWLPSNKLYRCSYVARQVAIKAKYSLYVTPAEKSAMLRVLSKCPDTKALDS